MAAILFDDDATRDGLLLPLLAGNGDSSLADAHAANYDAINARLTAQQRAATPPGLVDYTGWDQPGAPGAKPTLPSDPTTQKVGKFIGEGIPGASYLSSVFPMVGMAGDLANKFFGWSQAPRTGTLTPEQTLDLLSLVDPAARPNAGELLAFSGSRRAAREAEVSARVANTGLLGEVLARTEGGSSPGILGDSPLLRQLVDMSPQDSTVSTRVPYAKGQDVRPFETSDLRVGIGSATQVPEHADANTRYFRNYPGLNIPADATTAQINEALISHLTDNITSVFDAVPHGVAERNAGWYDGAHRLTADLADGANYTHQNVAGMMAALSPQKDWFENVELGKRLLDIDQNQQGTAWSPQMSARADDYIAGKIKEADVLARKKTVAAQLKDPSAPPVAPNYDNINATAGIINGMRDNNATFGSLTDPRHQAVWARFYDEAHNTDRSYPEIHPEGTYGSTVMQEGDPTKINPVKWGAFDQIENALTALRAQDLPTLSEALGNRHKVRSFYNNIISPDEENGAVTADTHAIAAGLFRPVGSKDIEVNQGLGSGASKNAETGNMGLYGLYDEAYRQAAARIQARYAQDAAGLPDFHADILPRQVQSVTWEAIRKLFDNKSEANKRFAVDQWTQVAQGRQSAENARANIIQNHGGYGY